MQRYVLCMKQRVVISKARKLLQEDKLIFLKSKAFRARFPPNLEFNTRRNATVMYVSA